MGMSKEEKVLQYLQMRMQIWNDYHSHKESMVNAGFLVQLSLFGTMITETIWPPEWVNKLFSMPDFITYAVYLLLWFLIHFYTRWQMINKRIAALYFAGMEKAFYLLLSGDLKKEDFEPNENDAVTKSAFKDFMSKIVYVPGGWTKMDASVKGMPKFVAKCIEEKFKKGTGAETVEILMTYTSILLAVIVGVKIFAS